MTDIIWGNGNEILAKNLFVLNVTHRKDGNKDSYQDCEKIRIIDADVPGLSQNENEWNEMILQDCISGSFLKCEIQQRDESGVLLAKVSHSGVGGY